MHALRVELLVNYVMRRIVPETEAEPFQYWLRFEFGTNTGNPHAHGMTYVAGNPNFECVVADEEARAKLLARKHPEVLGQTLHDLRTWEEAEADLASFYDQYVRESHPAKEANGEPLYPFLIENLLLPGMARPQTVNLYDLLERTFATPGEPDLSELKTVLLALIEDGQRHTWHGHRVPTWGRDPCARKLRRRGEREQVYCRYLFLLEHVLATVNHLGHVRVDPYRQNLLNLFLGRNDSLLNNFEEHLLLMNMGNVDWRLLINLWSVLEYLSKYTAKIGKATHHIGKLFGDVAATVCEFEQEDGVHDLWRRTIMKFTAN